MFNPRTLSILFLFCAFVIKSQEPTLDAPKDWRLRLSSSVELRTWKLTTKAEKTEEPLAGATIVLLKGTEVVQKSATNGQGGFEMLVPGNGEFILEVSYKGCNTKRFYVNTMGVPADLQKDASWKPTFSIGGFVMARAFPGIDYSGLSKPLVKVAYESRIKNFDDDEDYTDVGLGIVSKIWEAENTLIEKFCQTNRLGDAALAVPDCPLAKKLYNEAIALIPGEQYPVVQLAKVGECLKAAEEQAKKKAEEEAAKKAAAAEKAANKAASELAAKEKAEADKIAKINDKAASDKAVKDKAAAKKAEADRVAKDKAASESAAKESDKLARQQKEEEAKKNSGGSTNSQLTHENPPGEVSGPANVSSTEVKHSIPQVLNPNKYRDALKKAEDYYKMKRWAEAKPAYEEVLKIKPDDTYSKGRLAEVEKHLNK
jgi:tetratricopeptide (TPR) repeat protein